MYFNKIKESKEAKLSMISFLKNKLKKILKNMEKLNKALLYALTKAVGKTDDEILNLVQTKNESGELTLKDNADELLLNIITDKLKAVKGNPDEVWDKAWKKAQKETLDKAEKLLKEAAGIDLDGETFDEKVRKFVDITNQKASKNKGAINFKQQ